MEARGTKAEEVPSWARAPFAAAAMAIRAERATGDMFVEERAAKEGTAEGEGNGEEERERGVGGRAANTRLNNPSWICLKRDSDSSTRDTDISSGNAG